MTNRATTPSARLLAVAELVAPGSRVADVGTGHGLLPRFLLETGRAEQCIATERGESRLLRVARTSDPRIVLRHGDGLDPLHASDRIDVVVVAGLGGPAIGRILDSSRREELGARRFVLQPQTDAAGLRRHLVRLGLAVVDERLALSLGRYYPVVAAEPGSAPLLHPVLSPDDLLAVGPCLVDRGGADLEVLWRREVLRLRAIVARARSGRGRDAAFARLAQAERILAAISGSASRTLPSSDPPGSSRRSRRRGGP